MNAQGLTLAADRGVAPGDPPLKEVIYTPESPVRHPGKLVAAMWRDLLASRELAWRLFVRDVSSMYRQSVLGYVWAFVPPVMAALPWVFLNSQKIVNVGNTPIPYPAYVMTGMMLWQSFMDALNSPLKQTGAARPMLSKINFPREALLLAGVAEVVWNLLIRMTLLVPVLWLYGSWNFSGGNLGDATGLAQQLHARDSALSSYLWSHLPEQTQAGIAENVGRPLPNSLQVALVRDLNVILKDGALFTEERFAGAPLSADLKSQALQGQLSGRSLVKLNRQLLEEAYPGKVVPYTPAMNLLAAPLGLLGLVLLGFSIGLLITPLGLLYTDVARGIGLVAGFGMLLTPIVYPPRTTGLAGWLATWNPVSPVLVTARDWFTGQPGTFVEGLWWVTAASFLLAFVAWFAYRLTMPVLVERI